MVRGKASHMAEYLASQSTFGPEFLTTPLYKLFQKSLDLAVFPTKSKQGIGVQSIKK